MRRAFPAGFFASSRIPAVPNQFSGGRKGRTMNPFIQRRGACYLLVLVAVCAIPVAFAQRNATSHGLPASIIVVTNANDSGPGSLRDALASANDGDTIDFESSLNGQTITLTSGQLVVDNSVTISGPGANLLALDGNANDRIFSINPGGNPGE